MFNYYINEKKNFEKEEKEKLQEKEKLIEVKKKSKPIIVI